MCAYIVARRGLACFLRSNYAASSVFFSHFCICLAVLCNDSKLLNVLAVRDGV